MAVIAVGTLFGCGTGDIPSGYPVAVDDGALLGPGSPVADGLVVQDGSELVAGVFPLVSQVTADDGSRPVGWQAVFVVTGDPLDVWDRYTEAFELDEATAQRSCVVEVTPLPDDGKAPPLSDDPTEAPPQRFVTEPVLEGENRLMCSVATWPRQLRLRMVVGVDTSRCLPYSYGLDPCRVWSAAHLVIQSDPSMVPSEGDHEAHLVRDSVSYGTDTQVSRRNLVEDSVSIPDGPLIAPGFGAGPYGESHLPGPGDRIDDEMDYQLGSFGGVVELVAVLPDGMRSVVAPSMFDCGTSGLVAVLESDDSASDVALWFRLTDTYGGSASDLSGTTDQGEQWDYAFLSAPGGYKMAVTAVDRDDGTSRVLVRECGD